MVPRFNDKSFEQEQVLAQEDYRMLGVIDTETSVSTVHCQVDAHTFHVSQGNYINQYGSSDTLNRYYCIVLS